VCAERLADAAGGGALRTLVVLSSVFVEGWNRQRRGSAGWIGGNGSVVQKGGGYRRRCRAVAGGCGPNRHHCQVARRVRRVVVEGFGLGLLLLFSWIPSVNVGKT
jgi:hypothetical protein